MSFAETIEHEYPDYDELMDTRDFGIAFQIAKKADEIMNKDESTDAENAVKKSYTELNLVKNLYIERVNDLLGYRS